jgi:predicted CoA-substrate-specific enzyme activase
MVYRLGIDAGSKTIKLVLLDEQNNMVFSQYMLHRSDIITTMKNVLHDTIWRFGDAEVTVCVTGSAGMRLAELLGVTHVQEVISTRHALGVLIPQADVAIELGGEDAKIIYLSGGVEQRMNGTCAGGTGGFIDLMCTLLGVKARQFNTMALGHQMIYPIASRCAVFAQTDVRPLLNEGARRSDIAASILQAVVTQTIAGLSCGRLIKGTVVFLGGPFEVYSELVSRFRQTLGLTFAQTIKPPDAHLFVAKGAALLSERESSLNSLQMLYDTLAAAPVEKDGGIGRLRPLFDSEEELAAFRLRHGRNKVLRARLMDATGDIFVGVDAGSTAVKLAVVNEAGELIYSGYEKSKGEVLETTRELLEGLYGSLPHEYGGDPLVNIRHTKVTGYGERFLQTALNADSGVVETVAHLRAAQAFEREVDFVLDIGGQDIKCIHVRNGVVDDIMLNESCSSGCGALIDGFSRSLGFTPWSFSDIALLASRPVDLGIRCTVFMTSRVRHAQKEGVSAADIAAGLAHSVVRNALYKVIGYTDPSRLGTRVVVQGGTLKSDAVLRAFELESGFEVVRPDIAEMMGAYGAALLARDESLWAGSEEGPSQTGAATSSLLRPLELASLKRTQATRRCQGCGNNCLLTINTFTPCEIEECVKGAPLTERTLVTGNRCDRGGAEAKAARDLPNLFVYERQLLASCGEKVGETEGDADMAGVMEAVGSGAVTIGIPNVLDLYESYPFWRAFFTHLGLRVIEANSSNSDIYRRGAHAVLSEGACYPAKLAHGHVSRLIEQGADFIFMPTGGSVASAREGVSEAGQRRTIECPVSGNYARIIAEDVADSDTAVSFLTCDMGSVVPLARQLNEALDEAGLTKRLSLDERRVNAALMLAAHEQELFYQKLAERSGEVLAQLAKEGARGIVLAGHPYHVDAGMSHGVDTLLNSLGFSVLSASGILAWHRLTNQAKTSFTSRHPELQGKAPAYDFDLKYHDIVAATWTQPVALYELARIVAGHEHLDLVQLYSFGCGVDALCGGHIREILEDSGKPYTALKMDEMVDLAAIRIRLRSLAVALHARVRQEAEVVGHSSTPTSVALHARVRQEVGVREGGPALQAAFPAHVWRIAKGEEVCVDERTKKRTPLIIMPALAPRHLAIVQRIVAKEGYRLELLPELSARDTEVGLRLCDNDLCHPMIAVAGQIIDAVRNYQGVESVTVVVPQMCCGCRAIELEQVIREQLRQIHNVDAVEVIGLPSRKNLVTLSARLVTRIYDELAAADGITSVVAGGAGNAMLSDASACSVMPSIGVVGTAALLYTPQLNRELLRRIEAEGCKPHIPFFVETLTTNAPLEHFIERFVERGIFDIICVQSFGCLTGHIHGRGAAKRLRKRYPDVNISFIDYDAGTSEVNQDNRLKLALTLARERALFGAQDV